MARTVLRIGGEGITHVLFATFNGIHHYLTKADSERVLGITEDDVMNYYSGDDQEELNSLKEDISELVTGAVSLEAIKYRIAKNRGVIQDDVLEVCD